VINKIDVFLNMYRKEILVGYLAYKDKKIYFEYDKLFLQSGIELSPYKLPLKSGLFTCEDDLFEGLFGLFADSLPDGWGRLLLDRYFLKEGIDYSDINPLDRLSFIGSFGIGALLYKPCVKDISNNVKNILLDKLSCESIEILNNNSEKNIEQFINLGGSSAGARPKVMIQLNKNNDMLSGTSPLQNGYKHYIVKFASSTDSIDIGKIEYIYSLMAKEAGIDMPDTRLLKGDKGYYFAIERFDRIGDNRVHIHSVAGLTHSDFRFPILDYDDLLGLTLHLTKDVNELLKMYRLSCFNLFSHNRDDHAKNFSFILDIDNNWKLSPAYDLTFSYGPGGEHSTTYLGVGKNPTKEHLIDLANKHNIQNAKTIIDEVRNAISKFEEYAIKFDLSSQSTKLIMQGLKI